MDVLVTSGELARLLGRSPRQLERLLALGLPIAQPGGPGRPHAFRPADCFAWLLEHEIQTAAADTRDMDQAEAERRKIVADARLAEIKLAEALRAVVLVEDVARLWSDRCAAAREVLAPVPARLAEQLVGLGDEREIERILEAGVDEALHELAEWEPEELEEGADRQA